MTRSPHSNDNARSARPGWVQWKSVLEHRWVLLAAVVVAVVLRCLQFAANRSLFIDEAAVGLNLRNRSLTELLSRPLDFAQTAAPAFLALQKLLLDALGESEFVLRLVPFVAGIVSIPLFVLVARRILAPAGATVSTWLFATSVPLIYFTSNAKPYAVDLLAALILMLCGLWLCERGTTWRRATGAALAGGVAVWLSQPALFVLGGVAVALLARARMRDGISLWPTVATIAVWVLSATSATLFAVKTISAEGRSYMRDFWNSGFLPVLPESLEQWLWLPLTIVRVSADPIGAGLFPGLTAFVLLVGFFELRHFPQSRLLIVVVPMALTLLASAAGQYPFAGSNGPFAGRVLIFLAPSLLLITGAGVMGFARQMRPTLAVPITIGLVAANVWPVTVMVPVERGEIRPVLEYVAKNRRPGDEIYVYYGARHVYEWYAHRLGLHDAQPRFGVCARLDPAKYLADLARIGAPARVWVILNHVASGEELLIRRYFDLNGRELVRFDAPGARALLYHVPSTVRRLPSGDGRFEPHAEVLATGCRGLHDWPS